MSRRPPNPAAERAAQNSLTIKSLLKLEANKICSDCKRNKHPRWASWNLGVFICIRCSGIHRGMGTHISRVKSVDLDSWTDEQLQSILSWGNARANKYWEAKLAQGHVPQEAKIENFIRTKYELKRWVMDGPIPDPASLDAEGDDDVPLSIVKEKASIERKESLRKTPGQTTSGGLRKPPSAPQADLIGGDPIPRSSTAPQVPAKEPPKAAAPPPSNNSLLRDFMDQPAAAPNRPASTASTGAPAGQSRTDIKQSILSLYATAPRPQPTQQVQATQQQQTSSDPFSGMTGFGASAQTQSPPPTQNLNDAFGGLSFGAPTGQKSPQTSNFSGFASPAAKAPATTSAFGGLGGGSFFDSKPAVSAPSHQSKKSMSSSNGFGDFTSPISSSSTVSQPKASTSALDDMFGDFGSPMQAQAAPSIQQPTMSPAATSSSVFNLTPAKPEPPPLASKPVSSLGGGSSSGFSNDNVWGDNAWASNATPTTPAAAASQISLPPVQQSTAKTNDFGWGSSSATNITSLGAGGGFANTPIVPGASGGFAAAPKVAADEEFGGWASSTGPTNTTTPGGGGGGGSGGFGASEDLFSNVWK